MSAIPNILVCDDAEGAARQCAALIAREARAAIDKRTRTGVALSGGRTPWAMIRALAAEKLSWRDVHVFQADERVVPLDSPDRSITHIRQFLPSSLPSPAEQLHAMPVGEHDLAAAARHYATLLEHISGSPPVLDVVHLGLGVDGHTASLIPGDPVLNVTDADVALSGPYQGDRRMTLTYPILNRAARIVWLVTGEAKAEALHRLCEGDTQIPAGRVRRDGATVVTDRHAARLLHKDACRYPGHGP